MLNASVAERVAYSAARRGPEFHSWTGRNVSNAYIYFSYFGVILWLIMCVSLAPTVQGYEYVRYYYKRLVL